MLATLNFLAFSKKLGLSTLVALPSNLAHYYKEFNKYYRYFKVVLKLFSNSNTYLQISGEKKYNVSSLLTSGENCVPSTFLNTKKVII